MQTKVDLKIFSPRWGHDDIYTFILTPEFLEVQMQARKAKCTWVENKDPKWSGETLKRIFNNDLIYPPEIFQDLVEHAWKEWRSGEINSSQVNAELTELAEWLNVVTKAKPRTEFWKHYF